MWLIGTTQGLDYPAVFNSVTGAIYRISVAQNIEYLGAGGASVVLCATHSFDDAKKALKKIAEKLKAVPAVEHFDLTRFDLTRFDPTRTDSAG